MPPASSEVEEPVGRVHEALFDRFSAWHAGTYLYTVMHHVEP
jgi:hypothetical protein